MKNVYFCDNWELVFFWINVIGRFLKNHLLILKESKIFISSELLSSQTSVYTCGYYWFINIVNGNFSSCKKRNLCLKKDNKLNVCWVGTSLIIIYLLRIKLFMQVNKYYQIIVVTIDHITADIIDLFIQVNGHFSSWKKRNLHLEKGIKLNVCSVEISFIVTIYLPRNELFMQVNQWDLDNWCTS